MHIYFGFHDLLPVTKKDNLNIVTVPTKNYMIQKMHKDYFNFNKVLKFDQREEKSWLSSVDNDTYVLLENKTLPL